MFWKIGNYTVFSAYRRSYLLWPPVKVEPYVSRTYGTHKNLLYSPIFTINVWSYLLWAPVLLLYI